MISNKAVAIKFHELFDAGEIDRCCDFFAPHVELKTPQGATYSGIVDRKLDNLPVDEFQTAQDNLWRAEHEYRQSQGFLWSCSGPCPELKEEYHLALQEFNQAEAEYNQGISDAKREVGLFSSYGVEETRNMFWGKFSSGQRFAKRQTMWDAMFMGIGAMTRDETMGSYILRVVMNMILNFTIGLIGALIGFWWGLWGLITSYQASTWQGLFFFVLAGLAGWSMVSATIGGLVMGTAGSLYVMQKIAAANQIEGQRRGQSQPRYVNQGRPHYE
ncbi:hypothetical protein SARC_01119 [Sphaeroforma arctica JP610]|uniref:Uncharacterized protein n=1 Tax=Sphaeroforma arctica JP610 TaxID=667725 RepID=A0A0L0GCK1_9EUKA|nr:hypothetical protein SARC_01119 [Sphaeroforma arctica JP610]KNC86740.1 hypothetical protein SARC_01119 [Sphaeroforma arctica JP610]|eukprot:XP_014160642.1 hypothetical protein SARC_01119 [Sphaeroforma arctica JP610]